MKKRFLSLIAAILLLAIIPFTAYAVTSRTVAIIPRISFSGSTATCSVDITGYSLNDELDVVVKLWKGNTCLDTWYANSTGFLFFKDYYNPVQKGITYNLTVELTVNGTTESSVSTSKKYE
jgi:hypothetical protein